MTNAIEARDVAKRYVLGSQRAAYDTLREDVMRLARRLVTRRPEGRRQRGEVWALDGVSFAVRSGEVVGLIGANGAGKTTMLRLLSQITEPTLGEIRLRGRVGSLLEVGTGFHPELTGRENVYLNGAILGMRRAETARKFDEIVEFAGVERFIDTPVKRYSSGMYVRLAFSVAAHLEPEILLVDEVLAVGDAEFQKRCLAKIEGIGGSGRTVVFVSHSMPTILRLCERALLLDAGKLVADGEPSMVVGAYLGGEHGSMSARSWRDDTAPGDDSVRLRSVRIVNRTGATADTVDMRDEVGVEVSFEVLDRRVPMTPMLALYTERGEHAFNALDPSLSWENPLDAGSYVTTAWIPGNLLNEGRYIVSAFLNTLGPGRLERKAVAQEAVAFYVVNRGDGISAKGLLVQQWGGAVAPLLAWETSRRDEPAHVG